MNYLHSQGENDIIQWRGEHLIREYRVDFFSEQHRGYRR